MILLIFFSGIMSGFFIGDIVAQWFICKEFGIKTDMNSSWDSIFKELKKFNEKNKIESES